MPSISKLEKKYKRENNGYKQRHKILKYKINKYKWTIKVKNVHYSL